MSLEWPKGAAKAVPVLAALAMLGCSGSDEKAKKEIEDLVFVVAQQVVDVLNETVHRQRQGECAPTFESDGLYLGDCGTDHFKVLVNMSPSGQAGSITLWSNIDDGSHNGRDDSLELNVVHNDVLSFKYVHNMRDVETGKMSQASCSLFNGGAAEGVCDSLSFTEDGKMLSRSTVHEQGPMRQFTSDAREAIRRFTENRTQGR